MKLDRRLLRQARGAQLALVLSVVLGLLGVIVVQARLLSCVVSRVFLGGDTLS